MLMVRTPGFVMDRAPHDAVAETVHRAPEVTEFQAQDEVGLGNHRTAAPGVAKRMAVGEIRTAAGIHHRTLQQFGQLDQARHAGRRARQAVGNDHRAFRLDQLLGGFRYRRAVSLREGHARKLGDVQRGAVWNRVFLQLAVHRQQDRRHGRRHGDLVGAHRRLGEMLQRGRLIVPFDEIAHDHRRIDRRVRRFKGKPPNGDVHRVAGDHVDRDLVAEGVVQRHRGMLEPDGALDQHGQGPAFDLGIAMRHRHRDFLMHAAEHFRLLVHAAIDDRFVQAAEGRGGRLRDVIEIETLQHIEHEVGAAGGLLVRIGRRRHGLGGDIGPWRAAAGGRRRGRLRGGGCGRTECCANRRGAPQKVAAADFVCAF